MEGTPVLRAMPCAAAPAQVQGMQEADQRGRAGRGGQARQVALELLCLRDLQEAVLGRHILRAAGQSLLRRVLQDPIAQRGLASTYSSSLIPWAHFAFCSSWLSIDGSLVPRGFSQPSCNHVVVRDRGTICQILLVLPYEEYVLATIDSPAMTRGMELGIKCMIKRAMK